MCFFTNKLNGYFKDNNESRYQTLISTDKNKAVIKKYGSIWSWVIYLIKLKNKNKNHYGDKYIKIRYNLNIDLPTGKLLETYGAVIAIRSGFRDKNEYYPEIFLDECLYKLAEYVL